MQPDGGSDDVEKDPFPDEDLLGMSPDELGCFQNEMMARFFPYPLPTLGKPNPFFWMD